MKYLKQFGVILTFSFVGELLHYVLPLPIPASIYGIVLLFLGLEFHFVALGAVEETGLFLIEIMPVMFIPAAVGLLDSWSILRSSLLQYLATALISTIVVMAVSGRVTQFVITKEENRNREKKKGGEQE
ncbi:MAG: CidA/LrgA family protein [Clostridiales bacterium]|nr:CidA/LrgA family protein [Clostridiales bacterium]